MKLLAAIAILAAAAFLLDRLVRAYADEWLAQYDPPPEESWLGI